MRKKDNSRTLCLSIHCSLQQNMIRHELSSYVLDVASQWLSGCYFEAKQIHLLLEINVERKICKLLTMSNRFLNVKINDYYSFLFYVHFLKAAIAVKVDFLFKFKKIDVA